MKIFSKILLALALSLGFVNSSFAALPWGTSASTPLQVSGATPTCTYTATALACIENMTANVTSLTLAGMTAGQYYTIIWLQDGTGSRTLAQTPITAAAGGQAVPAIPSTANQYTAWVILATSASAATFVQAYDNVDLRDVYVAQITSSASATGAGATVAQGTSVFPGLTAAQGCECLPQTTPATWQTGVVLGCLATTNLATCQTSNASAGSITPAAITLTGRGKRP